MRFLTSMLFRRRIEREMDAEWEFHIASRAAALVASGVAPADAERQARAEFGDPLRWKEQGREARGIGWIEDARADAQYALRQMRREPGFAAVVLVTLTLGIGANTAIFSVANGLLLRTLPVADPERLMTVSSDFATAQGFAAGLGWNYPMWERLRDRAHLFGGAFAWSAQRLNSGHGGEKQPVELLLASGDFFSVLGVAPARGRTFTREDDRSGGAPDGPVAVISHRLWQRRYGGDPRVIGSPLLLEGVPFTIVGITPPEFLGIEVGRAFDVVVPLSTEPWISGTRSSLNQPRNLFLAVMLRLKPMQSRERAIAILRGIQPQILDLEREDPEHPMPPFLKEPFTLVPAALGVSPTTAGWRGLRERYRLPLVIVLAVSALVLLVACANLANLLLARVTARSHELSIRRALGASRLRLVRQWLLESLLVAGLGAAFGLVVAAVASRALVAQLSTADAVISLDLSFDWRVLAFTAAVALATMVLFGTAPALRALRAVPVDALTAHGPHSHPRQTFLSSALVIVQVALSLVLVVAAALFVRTFHRLTQVPLGFDPGRILVVNVDTAGARADAAARVDSYQRLLEAVAAVPGVSHAAASLWTPISGGGAGLARDAAGRLVDPARIVTNFISPGWFATYGIGLRGGRDLSLADTADTPPVAVINEAFARRFFRERNAIGESVEGMGRKTRTIVGIAMDAAFSSSLRDVVPPMMYVPLAQSAGLGPPGHTAINISIRPDNGSPMLLARAIGAALTDVDPELTYTARPLEQDVSSSMRQERLVAGLAGLFGILAITLAAVGLYGITAYGVSRRRTEIGVRVALGAEPRRVVRLILSRVVVLVSAGVLAGAAVSAWLSEFVAPLLYGVEPRDPVTLATAVLTLAAVGALAGWLPAAKAARIDPAVTLRE